MDTWIDLASGPLFRIALTVMILGLGYRLAVTLTQIVMAWRRAGDRQIPTRAIATATLGWLFPHRLLRVRPVYSAASFLFHLGIVVVPLFLAGHVALLSGVLPQAWPVLDPLWSDGLTVLALLGLTVLIGSRIVVTTSRRLTRPQDALLLVLLGLMMLFGFLAAHPLISPFPARQMVLLHMLLANLVLVLIPLTKIAHCVLYPFVQLLFQLGWHFPAETGRHVAIALGKEDEPV